jgi:integrase
MVRFLREHRMASPFSQDEDLVFASRNGTPLNHSNVLHRGFELAAEQAGLNGEPKLTFHGLRHSFASMLIDAGLTSSEIAGTMGHKHGGITEAIYVRMFDKQRSHGRVRAAQQAAMAVIG